MKTPHKYPSIEQIRELVENAPKDSNKGKRQSTKEFLDKEVKIIPAPLGYEGFDSLLISNYASDISSFRF